MPYQLDGKNLPLDRAFTHNGVQYPRNWLRLSTQQDRDAIGIIWVAPPPSYDQRFYWGYDANGDLIPKDHAQLVELWTGNTKQTAASLLTPYDWYIIRKDETGKAVPQEVLDYRAAVRTQSDNREVMIEGTTSTEQLAAVITGDFGGMFPWPRGPFDPAPEAAEEPIAQDETVEFIGGATSSGIAG